MATPKQGYPKPKPVVYEQLGIVGMSDARAPSGDPKLASLIYNAYPLHSATAHDLVGRPGVNHLDTVASPGLGQGSFQYRKLNGTVFTVVFINGLMYTVNWATGVHTNVALGAIGALQTTDKIYATILADKLFITDGVRKPFTWDGAAFVSVDNCPVLFGQPEVYYAKITGIVKANPVQIVWSEENDPYTGYDTQIDPVTLALYDNQWILGQTSQDRLYVLKAAEDALYFSRARSWSMITGPNEDDFRSTGNREAVSSTVGCTLPSVGLHFPERRDLVSGSRRILLGRAPGRPADPDLGRLPGNACGRGQGSAGDHRRPRQSVFDGRLATPAGRHGDRSTVEPGSWNVPGSTGVPPDSSAQGPGFSRIFVRRSLSERRYVTFEKRRVGLGILHYPQ